MIAIPWQESRIKHRKQIGGPAISYAQFEHIAVVEVLTNDYTRDDARRLCQALDVLPNSRVVHQAMQYCDVLAAGFTRLLLWLHPHPLPTTELAGWRYYIRQWKPGKPHEESWAEAWATAQGVVYG